MDFWTNYFSTKEHVFDEINAIVTDLFPGIATVCSRVDATMNIDDAVHVSGIS